MILPTDYELATFTIEQLKERLISFLEEMGSRTSEDIQNFVGKELQVEENVWRTKVFWCLIKTNLEARKKTRAQEETAVAPITIIHLKPRGEA